VCVCVANRKKKLSATKNKNKCIIIIKKNHASICLCFFSTQQPTRLSLFVRVCILFLKVSLAGTKK
jgi:hypothetical protein